MSDIKLATKEPNDQTYSVRNRYNIYIKDGGHGTLLCSLRSVVDLISLSPL